MNKLQSPDADGGWGPVHDKALVHVQDRVKGVQQDCLDCRKINLHEFKSKDIIMIGW